MYIYTHLVYITCVIYKRSEIYIYICIYIYIYIYLYLYLQVGIFKKNIQHIFIYIVYITSLTYIAIYTICDIYIYLCMQEKTQYPHKINIIYVLLFFYMHM